MSTVSASYPLLFMQRIVELIVTSRKPDAPLLPFFYHVAELMHGLEEKVKAFPKEDLVIAYTQGVNGESYSLPLQFASFSSDTAALTAWIRTPIIIGYREIGAFKTLPLRLHINSITTDTCLDELWAQVRNHLLSGAYARGYLERRKRGIKDVYSDLC